MICKIRELLTKPQPVIIHNYQKSSEEGARFSKARFTQTLEKVCRGGGRGCVSMYGVRSESVAPLRPCSTKGSNESNCCLIIHSCLLSVKIFALSNDCALRFVLL